MATFLIILFFPLLRLGAFIIDRLAGLLRRRPRTRALVFIPVRDVEGAAQFYGHILEVNGNYEQPRWGQRVSPHGHHFICGGVIVACVQPAEEPPEFCPNRSYVYLPVANIAKTYERATSAGCEWLEDAVRERPWGELSFYARDPFGNPVCFKEDRPPTVLHCDIPAGPSGPREAESRTQGAPLAEQLVRHSRASLVTLHEPQSGDLFLTDQRLIFLYRRQPSGPKAPAGSYIYSGFWYLSDISNIGQTAAGWLMTVGDITLGFKADQSEAWLDTLAERTGLDASGLGPAGPNQLQVWGGPYRAFGLELAEGETLLGSLQVARVYPFVPIISAGGTLAVTDGRLVFHPVPAVRWLGQRSVLWMDVGRVERVVIPWYMAVIWMRWGVYWTFGTRQSKFRYTVTRGGDYWLRIVARLEGWPFEDGDD